MRVPESIERRYLGLVRLSVALAGASDWPHVATGVSESIAPLGERRPTRLWAKTVDGFEALACSPAAHPFPDLPTRELQLAAERDEPSACDDGVVLVGLHAGGVSLGVLEIHAAGDDAEFVSHVASLVACRAGLLAAQGVGEASLAPLPVDAASDAAPVMSAFAAEAKRMLEHDRLSAYLLTEDGRSFERFAVATSRIIPGEGIVIPFGDVGLRSIVTANRPLISEDLGRDSRIVGREDRVIAAAGFHGLLSVPLRLDGRPIGVLNFVSRTVGFYRDQDVPVAQQIADQISVFLDNLRRQRGMQGAIRQEATERERSRLARDLYHMVSEAMLGIAAAAGELDEHLRAGNDAWATRRAERIMELARLELAEVRRAVIDLSPQALDTHTLGEVVESTMERLRRAHDLDVTVKVSGDTSTLPIGVAKAAYRILQEALANVHGHACASRVHVELTSGNDLALVVRDDGAGFDPGCAAVQEGFGLRGMRERAQVLGGELVVESAHGSGTTVRFDLPLSRETRPQPAAVLDQPERPGAATLRIVVAEPRPATRAGLAAMLERAGGIRVVSQIGGAEELEGSVRRLRPDVVLIDRRLAGARPAELVHRLADYSPSSRVLLIASSVGGWHSDLLEQGAGGIVHADVDASALAEAVRAVASGATILATGESTLSARELQILSLLAAGHTNKEIGEALFLASKTVERQVATITAKLDARNRAHAVAIAVSAGLVDLAGKPSEG